MTLFQQVHELKRKYKRELLLEQLRLYRVSHKQVQILVGVVEQVKTNKKLYRKGGLKCTPGELWAKYFFSDLLNNKILSISGLHFRLIFCMVEL